MNIYAIVKLKKNTSFVTRYQTLSNFFLVSPWDGSFSLFSLSISLSKASPELNMNNI